MGVENGRLPYYLTATSSAGERKTLVTALAVAAAAHLFFLALNLPDAQSPIPARIEPHSPEISQTPLPPPPLVEPPPRRPPARPVRSLIPGPADPERYEPELDSRIADSELTGEPPKVEFIFLGELDPPPPSGPRIVGGDVEAPVLIEESKISPNYPELARVARRAATVILQAVIHADGTIGEIEVLRCNSPGMGFEEASIEAVSQWLYVPSTQHGIPVDVFFTIRIVFELQ